MKAAVADAIALLKRRRVLEVLLASSKVFRCLIAGVACLIRCEIESSKFGDISTHHFAERVLETATESVAQALLDVLDLL